MKTGVGRRMGRRASGGDPGIWEAAGAGQVERRGGKALLGIKVPDAKKWRAKFPRTGGTCGGKDSTRG